MYDVSLSFFKDNYKFDFFIKGYENFFSDTLKDKIFTYEDFNNNPQDNLKNMCQTLKINFDDNFIEASHQSMILLAGTFHYQQIPNNLKYAKVFLNGICKSFFDIRNNENYGIVVRTPRAK